MFGTWNGSWRGSLSRGVGCVIVYAMPIFSGVRGCVPMRGKGGMSGSAVL